MSAADSTGEQSIRSTVQQLKEIVASTRGEDQEALRLVQLIERKLAELEVKVNGSTDESAAGPDQSSASVSSLVSPAHQPA